jgi:hypothetical protein
VRLTASIPITQGSDAMKSHTRSQAARRRAAAAAAVASVGAGFLGTQSAEAAIVPIDLTNVNGQNFTGVNAGLSAGSSKRLTLNFGRYNVSEFDSIIDFEVGNNKNSGPFTWTGIRSYNEPGYALYFGGIANGGSRVTPTQYAYGATIGGPVSAFQPGPDELNAPFKDSTLTAPNFDGYIGFLSCGPGGEGTDGVYGWIRATWDGTDFQLYSAAYESNRGQPIAAGVGVPEPSTTAASGLGALALGAGAVRKQRAARRTQAAAAVSV